MASKLIPVGDIATNDEFAAIKGISTLDVLTCHRFPVALAVRGIADSFFQLFTFCQH